MILSGLHKNSLIDYPKKISCIVFTSGCNFHCPYCHNPRTVNRDMKFEFTEDLIYKFIESRKGLLDGVVISGGEPTLQPDLISFCRRIKEIGFPIKLDTNGSNPKVIQELLKENLIDYIAMDVKTDPKFYSKWIQKNCDINSIIESIKIIMNSDIDYEFRTTCIKPLITIEIMKSMSKVIQGAKLYILQTFNNNSEVLSPKFFEENDYFLSENDMLDLKYIVEPYVKKCFIR